MTIVTRRNLLTEKTRFAIAVGGIALSVFLISFLLSNYQAWNHTIGRFVERVDADIWVARQGTISFLAAASILPEQMGQELALVPGVERVDPIIVRPMNVKAGDGRADTHLVGYEVEGGAGGPLSVTKGEQVPGEGQAIIDKAFAKRTGTGLGDTLQAAGPPPEVG